jgi:hypothetical protein
VKRTFLFLGLFVLFSSFANADDDQGDILDRKDYDPNTPYYQIMPPTWAFGMRVAVSKFPTSTALGSIYELYAERQLRYQKLGILSLGVHLGTAPLTSDHYENLKYGAVLRYQLHLMANQIVVPTAALVYDGFRLKDGANVTQSVSNVGMMFGGMLNLGFFDTVTARQSHESLGLLRTYLTFELRPLSVSSAALTSSSTIWYMGLRLETE